MKDAELLILNYDRFSEKAEALFESMRHSRSERALFITDPAAVLSRRFLDGHALNSPTAIDRTNRVIFALLSNPKFTEWANRYQRGIYDELKRAGIDRRRPREAKKLMYLTLGKRKLFHDLAHGMKEFGDPELFQALIAPVASGVELPVDPTAVLITSVAFFVQVAVFVDSTLAFHTSVATEQKADHHAVSSTDVFLISDHVMFTTVDFFVDSNHAASSDSQADTNASAQADTNASAQADTNASAQAQADTNASAQAQADSNASAQAQADSNVSAQADSNANAQADSGSESSSESGSESGSATETAGFGALFGFSRVELQQFASIVAQQMAVYASVVRESGALRSETNLSEQIKDGALAGKRRSIQ